MTSQPASTTARCSVCGVPKPLQMLVKLRTHPNRREQLLCPGCLDRELGGDDDPRDVA